MRAVDALQSPYAQERFSTLTGEPLFVVDLRSAAAGPVSGRAERALARLAELACPSVAIGAAAGGIATSLADAVDVRVADPDELAPLIESAQSNPTACLALVQLLRSSLSRSIHEGLLAESLVYSTLQSGPEFASWLATRRPASPRESLAPAVLVEREGSQLKLRLNRPEKHNAFSKAIRDGLVEALRVVLSDDTIREVELSGQGPSFCSGGDLDEFGSFPDPATAHAIRSTRNPARLLAECAERVQVRVHGACIGAGAELPAFTARVEAAPDAFFALPELRMGLVPGAGGTVSLPRRIGRQRCGWLALSGQRIDSATALEWGLVDSIRPD